MVGGRDDDLVFGIDPANDHVLRSVNSLIQVIPIISLIQMKQLKNT